MNVSLHCADIWIKQKKSHPLCQLGHAKKKTWNEHYKKSTLITNWSPFYSFYMQGYLIIFQFKRSNHFYIPKQCSHTNLEDSILRTSWWQQLKLLTTAPKCVSQRLLLKRLFDTSKRTFVFSHGRVPFLIFGGCPWWLLWFWKKISKFLISFFLELKF